ncbi:hypothetical protein LTR91_009557 [Friedmanniomyces endolithicus]|uniref:Uncharacterized protein n=1 Tax=Friedmanniomyces endolithicus TaxID=329885 RepID=A0AAN6QTH3_9PEZI|nr:hypothetical protein LTS00_013623 [Friedmanniomyces endolithicus]KAK0988326.1 hypothetical protein LTR91_009557 [Friedmanniomyces endolithicus]
MMICSGSVRVSRGPSPRDPPPRPRPGPPERGDGPFFDGGGGGIGGGGGGGGGLNGAAFHTNPFNNPQPPPQEEPSLSSHPSDAPGTWPHPGPPMPERSSSTQDPLRAVFGDTPPPGTRAASSPFPTAGEEYHSRPTTSPASLYGSGSGAPEPSPYGNPFGAAFVPSSGAGPSSRPLSPVLGSGSGPPGILRSETRRPGLGGGGGGGGGGGKNVSFHEDAKLSRSRADEEMRGEAEAGSLPGARDV